MTWPARASMDDRPPTRARTVRPPSTRAQIPCAMTTTSTHAHYDDEGTGRRRTRVEGHCATTSTRAQYDESTSLRHRCVHFAPARRRPRSQPLHHYDVVGHRATTSTRVQGHRATTRPHTSTTHTVHVSNNYHY